MALQEEIDQKRSEIHTDGYPMSIGELISIYQSGELDIHPEFQRFFRWSTLQKTRLIESILLGIPIPSVFVSQRDDGIWDVIDGLQRLSTIFQFVGVLKDESGASVEPIRLLGTKYLPSLAGKVWNEDTIDSLTNAQRLSIKRSKLDLSIIKKESDPSAKYELFQRLNSGGANLSAQELRNCLVIMADRTFHQWLNDCAKHLAFQSAVSPSDKQIEEQYDLELVVRFLALGDASDNELRQIAQLGEFLDDFAIRTALDAHYDRDRRAQDFGRTFELIDRALGDSAFRRYDPASERFLGGFLVSAFETIAIGVGSNIDAWDRFPGDAGSELADRVKALWANPTFRDNSGSGVNAFRRVPVLVPLGREVFAP
jgi:hypothetical protein